MKTVKKIYTVILGAGLMLGACSDGFDNINTEYLPSLDPAESDLVFAMKNGAIYGGAHLHQRIKNIYIDTYSHYFENGAANRTYTPNDSYNTDYWADHYRWILHTNSTIEKTLGDKEKINMNSIARIWRVYLQSQFTDFYGPSPMPLVMGENVDYTSLQSQYDFFFKELNEAVAAIDKSKKFVSKSTQDVIFQGDLEKWQRFGNSLHLRLAIKLSEVAPDVCSSESKKAISNVGGLMQSNADNALAPNMSNGLWGQQYNYYMYQQSWGGKEVMTTTMEKLLTNLGGLPFTSEADFAPVKVDPRGLKYFDVVSVENEQSKKKETFWRGIPPGLNSGNAEDKKLLDRINANFSYLSAIWVVKDNTKQIDLFMYSEVCFLMAEANERGFVTSGSASDWYNKGITASMSKWGISADNISKYLASSDKNERGTSVLYSDSQGAGNTKLEKIITQKYISNFPDQANEAWNDKRRLNLPAFDTPRYSSPSAGNYPVDGNILNPANFISRMAYPQQEVFVNKDKYDVGVGILNKESGASGGDKTSSPLWWASKRSNYCTSVVK